MYKLIRVSCNLEVLNETEDLKEFDEIEFYASLKETKEMSTYKKLKTKQLENFNKLVNLNYYYGLESYVTSLLWIAEKCKSLEVNYENNTYTIVHVTDGETYINVYKIVKELDVKESTKEVTKDVVKEEQDNKHPSTMKEVEYFTYRKDFLKKAYGFKPLRKFPKEYFEDIFQDTLLEVVKNKPSTNKQFKIMLGFRSYWRLLDLIRKQTLEAITYDEDIFIDGEGIIDFRYSYAKDIRMCFRDILEDKEYKLLAKKLDGWSNIDIAKELQKSVRAIEDRFSRIFNKIRNQQEIFEVFLN